jgi:hypothetical protein
MFTLEGCISKPQIETAQRNLPARSATVEIRSIHVGQDSILLADFQSAWTR